MRRAFDALIDAIAAVPRGLGEEAAPSTEIVALHALALDFQAAPPLSRTQARRAARLLERVQATLAAVRAQRYGASSALVRDDRALHDDVARIDGSKPLRTELRPIQRALEGAERVLRGMAVAGGAD
jgi:hypothetical protein